ncbi:MAG: CHAT domain-containing protein, partial [Acidimicrobiales bacterium]
MFAATDLPDFVPFDLTVLFSGGTTDLWLSASSRLGAVNAVPRSQAAQFALGPLSDRAQWFRDAVGRGEPGQADGELLGHQLTDLVFGVPEIASLFERTRGAASAEAKPLLVRLLAAPEDVAALPWELMADPQRRDRALVMAPDTHVVRMAKVRTYSPRVAPVTPPLHMLLVLSNPTGASGEDALFDHYEEGRSLLGELQPLIAKGLLVVDVEDRPSIENLRRRIGARERGYHVVHYLGHARPDQLKLEDASGAISWEPSRRFNDILAMCPDLRLTFFAGCRTANLPLAAADGAGADGHAELALSIADRCVRDACQTVLGMQAVLPFRTEQLLTRFFYQALCSGATVARAVALARAAVRDDALVGAPLLDWAVPSVVTSYSPAALVDPDGLTAATVTPPIRLRRAQLKLGLVEPDREFFARFEPLREALGVLCRRSPERVLWVTGSPGAGKSRLIARALDELDDGVSAVLYVKADDLPLDDPVKELCRLVAEVLARGGHRVPVPDKEWQGGRWWYRLIEELVEVPFVLAIDDIDRAGTAVVEPLGRAVEGLILRRSQARVALSANDIPPAFLSDAATPLTKVVRVTQLGLEDVLQWVRRNRPALAVALSGATESQLASIWTKLSFHLDLWSKLAAKVAAQFVLDPVAAADAVLAEQPVPAKAPTAAAAAAAAGKPPDDTTETTGTSPAPLTPGPLRVAIAGPFTRDRHRQFAEAMTAAAISNGVAGRVVTADAPDAFTALATLLDLDSPFAGGTASAEAIGAWLAAALAEKPDIVLLDYGGTQRYPEHEALVEELATVGALVIAAGPNSDSDVPMYPAWFAAALAVGATGATDGSADHSPNVAVRGKAGKPELFAP